MQRGRSETKRLFSLRPHFWHVVRFPDVLKAPGWPAPSVVELRNWSCRVELIWPSIAWCLRDFKSIPARPARHLVPYRKRKICRNSVVIVCNLENKNCVQIGGTFHFFSLFFAIALTVSAILTFEIVYLGKYVKVTGYNFRNGVVRWQISKPKSWVESSRRQSGGLETPKLSVS